MLTLNDGRNELWQWDTGRKITVDAECSQVHFSNKVFGRSIDVDVIDGSAIIPDILLQTDKDLSVWAFVGTPENGYTKISKVFKVNKRNKPADYVFTPPEQTTLAEIMERLDDIESAQDPDAIKNAVDDYLANNPIKVQETDPTVPAWAKNEKKPTYTADEVGALSKEELSGAVNDALAQAKASGAFDGEPGAPGQDYVLTEDDKIEIAEMAAGLVEIPDYGGNVDQGNTIFNGKTASFYGDSLTEVNDHYTKGYHSWVKDLLGLASYNNYGVSGYTVSDVYNKVNSVTDTADIVFVMCGVNDQTKSIPLGAMGDNTTGTTYGALNLLCSSLKQKYPTSIVVFITPHYQTKYPHSEGITSYEVSKAVREVCEKYAIPVYDNFVLSGIYSTNFSKFTTDSCHWNNAGHEMVGKNLARFMLNSFRYIYGSTSGGDNSDNEDGTTVSVTGVTLNASSGTLTESEKVTLVATVLPSNATNKNVTWKSSNNSVATVSNGVVSAISEGTATITATTEDGGFTANYVLNVNAKESYEPAYEINVNATIKKEELMGVTHIGFLVKAPDAKATIRLEADAGDISKINPNSLNCPFEYSSVDNFNVGKYAKISGVATTAKDGNHLSIQSTATPTDQYWCAFVPFTLSDIPLSVQLSNVKVYIDDVAQSILAVGTFKDNSNGTYADITVN